MFILVQFELAMPLLHRMNPAQNYRSVHLPPNAELERWKSIHFEENIKVK